MLVSPPPPSASNHVESEEAAVEEVDVPQLQLVRDELEDAACGRVLELAIVEQHRHRHARLREDERDRAACEKKVSER